MKLCISQATTLPNSFVEDLDAYSTGGWTGMEVWLTKLETHLEKHTPLATKKRIEEKQIQLVAASYQGGLLLSQGDQRKAHFDHFKRRLMICQEFNIPTMVLVADFVQKIDPLAIERSIVSLKQAAQWAAGFDVRLALEFRGSDTFCSCLDTALTLVEQCEELNVGVNLDVFHFYKGSSKQEDLEKLTTRNLAFVQFCDVLGSLRELMTDSDRIMPGEGDFRLGAIVQRLREIQYDGWISLETMNPIFWQMKSSQVAELGHMAMRRLFE
jgi:2-keto-myo-inositol isomerase